MDALFYCGMQHAELVIQRYLESIFKNHFVQSELSDNDCERAFLYSTLRILDSKQLPQITCEHMSNAINSTGMSTTPQDGYSRKKPFPARMKLNRKLTLEGSEKETRHFEISLAGSGLRYEVGDSLGIFPTNDPKLVDQLLNVLGLSGDELITSWAGASIPLRTALLEHYIITEPSKQLLEAIAQKDPSASFLEEMLDPNIKSSLGTYTWGRDIIDSLVEFEAARFEPEEFVATLRKLQPRLYSIASSQKAYPEEVHLTVACVRYVSYERERQGVCSMFLAERTGPNTPIPVFVHTAKHFRLPEDPSAAVIMVGPGTGIAPFRAFLQERKATGATGRNWLFFGEQRAQSDFFYRSEFEAYQSEGLLSHFHTAFSRDQDYKIYVQHRMIEHGKELFDWLEKGAYFYVCGDAARMAKDVDNALHEIVQKQGGKSPEDAIEYVASLKKDKRYRRDVY